MCNIKVLEDLKIIFWRVSPSLKRLRPIHWTHEGNELAGNDEVKVTIFKLFVILVLFVVKLPEVVPSMVDRQFKTF
jgi:hypothetical protein